MTLTLLQRLDTAIGKALHEGVVTNEINGGRFRLARRASVRSASWLDQSQAHLRRVSLERLYGRHAVRSTRLLLIVPSIDCITHSPVPYGSLSSPPSGRNLGALTRGLTELLDAYGAAALESGRGRGPDAGHHASGGRGE